MFTHAHTHITNVGGDTLKILHVPKLLKPERMIIKINDNYCKRTKHTANRCTSAHNRMYVYFCAHKFVTVNIIHQNRTNFLYCDFILEVEKKFGKCFF